MLFHLLICYSCYSSPILLGVWQEEQGYFALIFEVSFYFLAYGKRRKRKENELCELLGGATSQTVGREVVARSHQPSLPRVSTCLAAIERAACRSCPAFERG